jgi:hypothetical protein
MHNVDTPTFAVAVTWMVWLWGFSGLCWLEWHLTRGRDDVVLRGRRAGNRELTVGERLVLGIRVAGWGTCVFALYGLVLKSETLVVGGH